MTTATAQFIQTARPGVFYAPLWQTEFETLKQMARTREPFYHGVMIEHPTQPGVTGPLDGQYVRRVPSLDFDFVLTGAASQLDLSGLRVFCDGEVLIEGALFGAAAPAGGERGNWTWPVPLFIPARRAWSVELDYVAPPGGLPGKRGYLIFQGVKLNDAR